jgi:hypothetical protein
MTIVQARTKESRGEKGNKGVGEESGGHELSLGA